MPLRTFAAGTKIPEDGRHLFAPGSPSGYFRAMSYYYGNVFARREAADGMKRILINLAITGSCDIMSPEQYMAFRHEFMSDPKTENLLPSFVQESLTLDQFYLFIQKKIPAYNKRRQFIEEAFAPLLNYLTDPDSFQSSLDTPVTDALRVFNSKDVNEAWEKALKRREDDPEGAITAARTLLETIFKHALEERNVPYTERADLPKLYKTLAEALNLAPDQHAEEPIKAILGALTTLVNGLGTLRNRLSDSHGRGSESQAKPAPRHAALAVNAAGTLALFIVETLRKDQTGLSGRQGS